MSRRASGSGNSYWDAAPTSFVRDSKSRAISQLSGPVVPQAEKCTNQSKKNRAPEDTTMNDELDASTQEKKKKRQRKTSSPKRPKSASKDEKKAKGKGKKKKDDSSHPRKLVSILRNVYSRPKKTVPPDEVAVCECKPERCKAPGDACGAKCINRLMFIECTADRCPMGGLCTNQRFAKREYAPLKRVVTENKGHGVVCEKDLEPGEFVIEYCGEVITVEECMLRLRRSRERGEKNFYILTLDASECVDAARRGNMARFINHSCEPNCVTQKWMVAGETCVGLFARCRIQAGTELTFDYQFERVGGDKQKCFCGAASCRGYLGAKKPVDEQTRRERKAKERELELKGRARYVSYEQIFAIVSDPDPPARPPNRVFLLRNARKGYKRWTAEITEKLRVVEKSSEPEKEVNLDRAIKKALAEIRETNPSFSLFE